MRNKKIIILLVVVILIVITGVIFVFSTNKPIKQNNNFFDDVQSSLSSCAKEGEQVRASGAGLPAGCCADLKAMYGYARENCKAPGLPGDIGTCSNCGNGSCETQNNENKCNCPEDCK